MQQTDENRKMKRMSSENKIKQLREKWMNSLKDEPEQLMK